MVIPISTINNTTTYVVIPDFFPYSKRQVSIQASSMKVINSISVILFQLRYMYLKSIEAFKQAGPIKTW